MKCTEKTSGVKWEQEGIVIHVDSLLSVLGEVTDHRKARGKRYALCTILFFVLLAKLCGEDTLLGIAEWVKYRIGGLAALLNLRRATAPHNSTYSRVLGHAVDDEELEEMLRGYFARQVGAGGEAVVAIDGKTLRGTIPAGCTRGRHLLAAYLPAEGWVMFQIEVPDKAGEVSAAPRILRAIDLRGKIVTGDAMFAQRELSLLIMERGGHYVWVVKENQPRLREDIATLFEPEICPPGFSPALKDFRTHTCIDVGHGRIERRVLTVSSELKGYLDWPGAEQVFKLERHVRRVADNRLSHEVVYGITSLGPQQAGPKRLLRIIRSHWRIENSLFYRRDHTLREDHSQVRMGRAPKVLAALNNLIVALAQHQGFTSLPQARRHFAAFPERAINLLVTCPT